MSLIPKQKEEIALEVIKVLKKGFKVFQTKIVLVRNAPFIKLSYRLFLIN